MRFLDFFNKKRKKIGHEESILSDSSPFALSEAYKMLRTNLDFVSIAGKCKKLIVTSSIPNEGKSTVAINLAISLAESGLNILLVDCDMRNPSVHRYLRMRNTPGSGLSSVLVGNADINSSILAYQKGDKKIFDFMPVGSIPPNPAEILGSDAMKNILDKLSLQYDFIICDTPPATVVSDAVALSRFCDGILLVIKHKFSTKQQVAKAKQNFDVVEANILGVILNQYDIADDPKHNGYGHNGYDYKYGYGSVQNAGAQRSAAASNRGRLR